MNSSLRPLLFLSAWLLPFTWACSGVSGPKSDQPPIALHPGNPHYFLFRGKPMALITSGEHYGAVLNRDFDYVTYLDTLQADGLNLTRTFSGAYVEPLGAFKIARNTLAPAAGRFLCPWARSDTPGYANGGDKFDLTKWDEQYFTRLRDFVSQASRRGVVVEMNLFCPFYEDIQWQLSPQNAENNVNGIGKVERTDVYTLDRNDGLLAVQEAMVRRIIRELREFDNVYYEICNEPYFGGVTNEWQRHIARIIDQAEAEFPDKHLISQNIANEKARIIEPDPLVSIFNFHYAYPPETVAMNFDLDRVIGDNETGFHGTEDAYYRREAWAFILAGGGLFNNLDYSFTVGHEDGSFQYPSTQPGGGSAELRRQLHTLGQFIRSFDFIRMHPDASTIEKAPDGSRLWMLSEPGRQYAVFLLNAGSAELRLALPPGSYQFEWTDPPTGEVLSSGEWTRGTSQEDPMILETPDRDELALKVVTSSP